MKHCANVNACLYPKVYISVRAPHCVLPGFVGDVLVLLGLRDLARLHLFLVRRLRIVLASEAQGG